MKTIFCLISIFSFSFGALTVQFSFNDGTTIKVEAAKTFSITQPTSTLSLENFGSLGLRDLDKIGVNEWTLIKLEEGQTAFDQIFNDSVRLYITSGSAEVSMQRQTQELKEGDSLHIPAQVMFAIKNKSQVFRYFLQKK